MANTRVIVVGSGLAGLSAASMLVAHHVPVLLLERSAKPGGNSIKASSGISGAPTRFQGEVKDSVELFTADTIRSVGSIINHNKSEREHLVRELTGKSSGAIEWLSTEMGVDLTHITQLGGHSRARTHRGSGKTPPGFAIINALLKNLQQHSIFELRGESEVSGLVHDHDGLVTGVRYQRAGATEELEKGPVIFTTGGFAGDIKGLLREYRPDLGNIPSTNESRPGMHKLLTEIGANLVDMELVQIHPTGFIDPSDKNNTHKFLAAELLRGEGGILVDRQGKRFINELATRREITDVIMRTDSFCEDPRQWDVQIVLDENTYQAAKSHVDFYMSKGLMRRIKAADMEPSVRAEIRSYGEIVLGASTDPFGRTAFGNWSGKSGSGDEECFYIGNVTPVVHFTMGGVSINTDAEVLKKDGTPIRGLWAAGEITGGIHGQNRLGGNSLLECVVFGRKAGENAAKWLSSRNQ
ncbi:uncharacterized protein PV09_07882 [Verruconis gallopava]|uniref:Fumarate reductase n=1 Tax=Verruconis gallopava TaxID=253628 RepID=A0A0D2A1H9_9PEZI|nr:uncharacterized protein PV09_07882 [Verruconis gallopava]KIW00523.1 hypothetical protein PV09_07882 [Verruconis gallopava]